MATFDPVRHCIVVRIVYAGAALAGKTTSLRALGASLGRPVFSGEEVEGRTLHFDWVDFVGGLFDGVPIRCQLVAVPGQAALAPRRRRLLTDADAVVLVADSTPEARAATVRAVGEMRDALAGRSPPVGVIVQANKRDDPRALPLAEVESWFADGRARVAVTETVASEGVGIRETFVFAVRLALDRVRELEQRGDLPRKAPEVDSGEALLAVMRAEEAQPYLAPSRTSSALESNGSFAEPSSKPERRRAQSGVPRLPTPDVPSGSVWPPVEGRVVLHQACRSRPVVERTRRGDWVARDEQWRWHSSLEDFHEDLAPARTALLDWARWHAQASSWLSRPRAIVLCETAPRAWRLWQIVGRVETLDDGVDAAIAGGDPASIAEAIWAAARTLLRAREDLVGAGRLPAVGCDVLALQEGQLVYAGLVPGQGVRRTPPRLAEEPGRFLRGRLGPLVERSGLRGHPALGRVLDQQLRSTPPPDREQFGETLAAMLLGH